MFLRNYFRRKFFFILFSLLFVSLVGGIILNEINFRQRVNFAQAEFYNETTGEGDATNGFAWTKFGWISFNSTDCDPDGLGAIQEPPRFIGDGPWGCPPIGTPFFDYGVDIEPGTGIFSGYAWSSNLGWIFFGPDTDLASYPNIDLSSYGYGNQTVASMPAEPRQWPTFDYDDNQVKGWARILSLAAFGDGYGWISFGGNRQDGSPWSNGTTIDPITSKMHGYAWGADYTGDTGNGVGWISFSCEDYLTCSGGTYDTQICSSAINCEAGGGSCINTCDNFSNHQVYARVNQLPEAINLEAPFLTQDDLCALGVRRALLKWEFSDPDIGDSEGAYRIVFDDDPDQTNPLYDTGKCGMNSTGPGCIIAPGVSRYPIHEVVTLNYNQHYYWWVTVWDQYGGQSDQESSITYYADFVVPGHEWPSISIDSYVPKLPSAGEEVLFEGSSSVYNFTNPGTPINCENDQTNCFWYWSADPAYYSTVRYSTSTSPIIIFNNSQQEFGVYLSVTDKDGYTCTSTPEMINPNVDLPYWIEVKD